MTADLSHKAGFWRLTGTVGLPWPAPAGRDRLAFRGEQRMIPVFAAMPERTAGLLQERVDKLLLELPGALSGDEEALHQMRVAARRLRAALPLLAIKPTAGACGACAACVHALSRAAARAATSTWGSSCSPVASACSARRIRGESCLRRLRAARTRRGVRWRRDRRARRVGAAARAARGARAR